MELIRPTRAYILEQFSNSGMEESHWRYRYEHSLRVAAIGRQIASRERLNREVLELACLLHDVGYTRCKTPEDFEHHGRLGAEMAEQFLFRIGLEPARVESARYGIFAHTEDEETLPRACSVLEASVADADNIDRFDALRMADTLTYFDLMNRRPAEIIEICDKQIERYSEYQKMPFATKTATELWTDRVGFQISYFLRLRRQMEMTK